MRGTSLTVVYAVLRFVLVRSCSCGDSKQSSSTCSAIPDEIDPALKEMSYDIGDGLKTTMVYIEPDVTTFYRNEPPPSRTKVIPKYSGFQGKFINLSNQHVSLYWQDGGPQGQKHLISSMKPFEASGTAVFPGHHFYFTELDNPDQVLQFVSVAEYPNNLIVYHPWHKNTTNNHKKNNDLSVLSSEERKQYEKWKKTLLFHEFYLKATGRSYLANYLRDPPMHHMWRADYFGQEHWITTKETHFVTMPPSSELLRIDFRDGSKRILKDHQPRLLSQYRDPSRQLMNMTLKVLSVVPRVFEVENFLSSVEVDYILHHAGAASPLQRSITGDGTRAKDDTSRATRTSFNSWLSRETSPIFDALYRRAADLQSVDEALMRYRGDDEKWPNLPTQKSLAESLQLVHYEVGQEYNAHHDFGFHRMHGEFQAARFSTLLLYLNDDGMQGGETSFPRYANAKTFHKLAIKPKAGKAVLFYSQLPDGNLDDFSQHAAEPVTEGEKWLMNLWLWDPVYRV